MHMDFALELSLVVGIMLLALIYQVSDTTSVFVS